MITRACPWGSTSISSQAPLPPTVAVRVTGVPITQEAEAGESFEPWTSEPIWTAEGGFIS